MKLSSIMLRFIPYTNTAGTPWANTIKFILDLIIYKIDFHNLPVQYIYLKRTLKMPVQSSKVHSGELHRQASAAVCLCLTICKYNNPL